MMKTKANIKFQIFVYAVCLCALLGQVFISFKNVEAGLWIWAAINPILIMINLKKKIYGQALLFLSYEIFVVIGLLNWIN